MVRFVFNVLGGDNSDNRFSFKEISGKYSKVGVEMCRIFSSIFPHGDKFFNSFNFSPIFFDVANNSLKHIKDVKAFVFAKIFQDGVAFRRRQKADHLVYDIFNSVSRIHSSFRNSAQTRI